MCIRDRPTSFFIFTALKLALFSEIADTSIPGSTTVSYTHLDVYKRQLLFFWVMFNFWNNIFMLMHWPLYLSCVYQLFDQHFSCNERLILQDRITEKGVHTIKLPIQPCPWLKWDFMFEQLLFYSKHGDIKRENTRVVHRHSSWPGRTWLKTESVTGYCSCSLFIC